MKILISCISLSLLTHAAFSSEILSEFGSSSFLIDSAFTTSPFIQNSNSITITGTDDPASVVYGSFTTPFTILDIPNSLLCLNFAISGTNPDSAFHIDLYNADASAWYTFTGTIEGVTSVASDVALVYYDLSGDPFNEVFTALIGFDGSGSDDINMTLNNISVVPEPATYLLITIAGLFFIYNSCRPRRTTVKDFSFEGGLDARQCKISITLGKRQGLFGSGSGRISKNPRGLC